MVDDLMKRYPIVGMTRSQVWVLLGTSDSLIGNESRKNECDYYLGPSKNGFDYLSIKFKDIQVVAIEVLTEKH